MSLLKVRNAEVESEPSVGQESEAGEFRYGDAKVEGEPLTVSSEIVKIQQD